MQNNVVPLFMFGCESSTIIATCDRQIDVLTRLWSACLENSFAGSTLLVISWFDFAYLLVYLLICLFACLFVCLLACLFACLFAYLLAYLLVLSSATATLIQWQLPARLLVSRTHEGGPTRLRWRPCVLFCILTRARDVAPIPVDASAVRRTPSPKRARTRDTSGHTRRRRNPKHFVCHLWQCVAFVSVPL